MAVGIDKRLMRDTLKALLQNPTLLCRDLLLLNNMIYLVKGDKCLGEEIVLLETLKWLEL